MDAIVQSAVGVETIEGNKDAQRTSTLSRKEVVVVATSKLESGPLDDFQMLT